LEIADAMRQLQPKGREYYSKRQPLAQNGVGVVHSKLQFTTVAGQIGKQIHDTAQKLGNLTKLARNTSLFDDKSEEIHQLTRVIKEDITALNHQIEALQNHVHSQRLLHKNKQTESHATNVVSSLKSKLAKTTKKFQWVLETRTKNLKVQQEKRQKFAGGSFPTRSKNQELFKPRALTNGGNGLNGTNNDEVVIHIGGTGMQQQQSLLGAHDSYIASRTEAVESIEQTIVELQGIFQQLATIVAEQGEMMRRIDDNVDAAVANVGGAQEQLLKYLQKISGNRWLVVKVFLVLIVFVIIFVVFFV